MPIIRRSQSWGSGRYLGALQPERPSRGRPMALRKVLEVTGRELGALGARILLWQLGLIRLHEKPLVISCMGDKITDLHNEIREMKAGLGLVAIAAVSNGQSTSSQGRYLMNMDTGSLWPYSELNTNLEVEENLLTSLLEDDNVPMEDEVHFDDSPVPPKV
ncbi:hypothetical protein GW17_00019323 [Ensete ventricosum]|nr:hypothetical protein GW17_00019323 [Ensete ventricosum]